MTATVYPSAIARACSSLDEAPAFKDLPDGYLRVVIRIIKKINLSRLNAPIVASRSTLAKESGKSLETVHRAISWMCGRGLICRTQTARAGLRGSSSPLLPTAELLDALLLTPTSEAKPASKKSQLVKPSYPQETAALGVSPDTSKSVSQEPTILTEDNPCPGMPSEEGSREPQKVFIPPFVQIENVKIPTDLAWLVSKQGLKATGVLALMAYAKASKQRLSDVVLVTKKYLEHLHGRELFAYLKALIRKDRDYTYLSGVEMKGHVDAQTNDRVRRKCIELEGREFRTRDAKLWVKVERNGILTEIREGVRICRQLGVRFLDAIEDGRLVAV